MITGWYLAVYDRADTSSYLRSITPADEVLSIDYVSVGGDGDCREMALRAKGGATGIRARDVVHLWISETEEGTGTLYWRRIFVGVVTQPGAARGPYETTIRAVGLRKRVHEVAAGADVYPQQDVASIAAALMTQYGGTYETPPTLGFQTAMEARHNYIGTLLDELAALCPGFVVTSGTYTYDGTTYGVGEWVPPVTWGVDDRGWLFFRRKADTIIDLAEGVDVDELASIETVAEQVTTRVLFLSTGPTGTRLHTYQDAAAIAEYGLADKHVAVATVDVDAAVPGDVSFVGLNASSASFQSTTDGGSTWGGGWASGMLKDNDAQTGIRDYLAAGGIGTFTDTWRGMGWTFDVTTGISKVRVLAQNESDEVLKIGILAVLPTSVGGNAQVLYEWDPATIIDGEFDINRNVDALYIAVLTQNSAAARDTRVFEFAPLKPEFEDIDALDRTGAALIVTPAPEAAEAYAHDFVFRTASTIAPRVRFTRADGTVLPVLDVLDIEHRLSAQGGYEQRIRAGAADNVEEIAHATLIRAIAGRDKRTVEDLLAAKGV